MLDLRQYDSLGAALRVALERWANHIEGLVAGRKAKVVSIERRR